MKYSYLSMKHVDMLVESIWTVWLIKWGTTWIACFQKRENHKAFLCLFVFMYVL